MLWNFLIDPLLEISGQKIACYVLAHSYLLHLFNLLVTYPLSIHQVSHSAEAAASAAAAMGRRQSGNPLDSYCDGVLSGMLRQGLMTSLAYSAGSVVYRLFLTQCNPHLYVLLMIISVK
jgi:hypothetical protein